MTADRQPLVGQPRRSLTPYEPSPNEQQQRLDERQSLVDDRTPRCAQPKLILAQPLPFIGDRERQLVDGPSRLDDERFWLREVRSKLHGRL
jgi:hypothetical protein